MGRQLHVKVSSAAKLVVPQNVLKWNAIVYRAQLTCVVAIY